jgi:exonuclease SbcC
LAERDRLQKTLASHLDPAEPTSLTAQLALIKKQLAALNYQPDHHEQVRAKLRSAQGWLARAETLRQCQQEAPQLLDRQRQLTQAQQTQTETQNQLAKQWAEVQAQLTSQPDPSQDLQQLDVQLNDLQRAIESTVAKQAQLSQQQEFLQQLAEQIGRDRQQLQQKHHQQRVYDELAKAFGKNGIQALAIETLLPQLEAEANRILSQLSANQLHINFVTQRLKKTATKRQKATDLASATIETLEIQIADAQGTRPYETYSGGESFRINFAIRLALSRLLAQRSGTALQLLIIDEGFGTQDDAGRDRLVAAINAIAPDFGCILTVTHIPQLKEAFTARIEVQKTAEGSKLAVFL